MNTRPGWPGWPGQSGQPGSYQQALSFSKCPADVPQTLGAAFIAAVLIIARQKSRSYRVSHIRNEAPACQWSATNWCPGPSTLLQLSSCRPRSQHADRVVSASSETRVFMVRIHRAMPSTDNPRCFLDISIGGEEGRSSFRNSVRWSLFRAVLKATRAIYSVHTRLHKSPYIEREEPPDGQILLLSEDFALCRGLGERGPFFNVHVRFSCQYYLCMPWRVLYWGPCMFAASPD